MTPGEKLDEALRMMAEHGNETRAKAISNELAVSQLRRDIDTTSAAVDQLKADAYDLTESVTSWISVIEQRVEELEQDGPPTPDPVPDPEPDPIPVPVPPTDVPGLTVLAWSPLRNVPVPLRRNSEHIHVFDPGIAGDHLYGIGAYEAGHHAGDYPEAPRMTVTPTSRGWAVPYERCPIRSMPIKLRMPVKEAWAGFTFELSADWAFGKSTKIGGFIGRDGRSGFSTRICAWDWNQNGQTRLGIYYYWPEQSMGWGDEITAPFPMEPGDVVDVVLHTKMQDEGQRNGFTELFVKSTRVPEWQRLVHAVGLWWPANEDITHWYWSHMYGGPWCVWAPDHDSHTMYLRDFAVAEKREDLLPRQRLQVQ